MISKSEDTNTPEPPKSRTEQEFIRLQAELDEYAKAAESNLAGWKRCKADYLNLEKEIEKNKQNWVDFANLDLIKGLIPIWISFAGLRKNLPADAGADWVKGLIQMHKSFEDFLQKS